MKHIRHANTLFYYDGPQVFEARDAIGGHYVAVLAPSDGADDRYLVAGVNPERLRQFRSGILDLRSLLVESDEEVRYLATASNGLDHPLTLERLPASFIGSELLPDFDFVLHDRPADEYVLREARARNNLILELAVEPPEAAAQHRIRSRTLAELLLRVHAMIRHASRAVTKEHPAGDRQPDDDMMDVVVPAAAGSFRIVLEAAKIPDLFGDSVLWKALQRVDTLFQNTADPRETLAVVRESRGHLAGAYLRLLRFLVERKTGLRYSWAEPKSERTSHRSVLQAETGPLVEALSSVTDLGLEAVTLAGTFERFNRESGAWGLLTTSGQRLGKVSDGGPSLDGLEVGGRYVFYCDEVIEEVDITGRESRTLYLNRHEPV